MAATVITMSLSLWSYLLQVVFPRKQTLSQRLAWRRCYWWLFRINASEMEGKGAGSAKGEIGLWCQPSSKLWGEGRCLHLGCSFRIICHWSESWGWAFMPPWAALQWVCHWRQLSSDASVPTQGWHLRAVLNVATQWVALLAGETIYCPLSLKEHLGRTITLSTIGIFQKNTVIGKVVAQE